MAKPDQVFFIRKTESPMKENRKQAAKAGTRKRLTPVKARKLNEKALIVGLYLQGNSMARVRELAEEQTGGHRFGRDIIRKYITEATEEWKASKQDMVENHKAIELEKINRLEATYWDAWARSCEVQTKTTRVKNKNAKEGGRLALAQVRDDERQTMGDPRFLTGIQWCTEMRCKILGIEIPQTALQMNTVNQQINNTTVINRKVVFLKRETTIQAQTIQTPQ
jgi:hypothetical protein